MKFKINDKYWPILSQYLTEIEPLCQKQSYVWTQQPESQTGILEIPERAQSILKYEQLIGEKLLSSFNKQRINNNEILVQQWMKQYGKIFEGLDGNDLMCENLNYMLLLNDYNQLKERIAKKKNLLKSKIRENQVEVEKFRQQSQNEEKKIQLSLDNLSHRAKIAANNQEGHNQQLLRVKSLIKNGLWGLSGQLEQKLKRIEQLEGQIYSLKTQK